MPSFAFIVVLAALVCHGKAKVTMTKGVSQTVQFDGDELLIELDNPQSQQGTLRLCFGSSTGSSTVCPQGYTGISVGTKGSRETYRLSRKGVLSYSKGELPMEGGDVRFEDDGSINILITNLPDGATLTLPNAELPVSTTTTLTSTAGEAERAVIGIIIGVVVLVIVVLIIVGSVLLYCCWWKKRSQQPVRTTVANDEPRPTYDDPEAGEPLLPMVTVKSPVAPPPNRPSATTTTKRTSTPSAKPANDKQPVAAVPKPKPVPKTPTTVPAKEDAGVSLTSDVTQQSAPGTTPNKQKSKASKKSKKSRKNTSTPKAKATPATPVEKPRSPSLSVDKTQTATPPSTLPTPSFTDDAVSRERAAASEFKKLEYLRRCEARVPGSTRSRPRSRPIVDEVHAIRLETESIYCFAERMDTLDNHNHWMIVERVSGKVTHVTSDAERALLKAAPEDAPALADRVVEEAEQRMAPYLVDHPLGWTEHKKLWEMINNPKTPTSVGYIAIYRLMPNIFKIGSPSLHDPVVYKMPLSGLYILLLDRSFPRAFRVKLAAELRYRASRILPLVQKHQVAQCAFPTNYMMLIYNKNQESFIEGREIHSAIANK